MRDSLNELKEKIDDYLSDMKHEVVNGEDFYKRHPTKNNLDWLNKAKGNLQIAEEMSEYVDDLKPMLDENEAD